MPTALPRRWHGRPKTRLNQRVKFSLFQRGAQAELDRDGIAEVGGCDPAMPARGARPEALRHHGTDCMGSHGFDSEPSM